MKNPYIIPAAMICAAILAGFWMLKSPSEQPQKVIVVQPPQPPDISIHDAVRDGNIEAVKQHLAAGTDVNAKDDIEYTPLHYAATKAVAELLITKGADVNAKTWRYGRTPLDKAGRDHSEIYDLLRKHGARHGSIHSAVSSGNIETVKRFLSLGVDVNEKSLLAESTPLLIAVRHRVTEIVELLIANGADVNAKNKHGWTPLRMAAGGAHKEIVEFLIANGANVNPKDGYGETPLDRAEKVYEDTSLVVSAAKKEIAALLRKHGGKTGDELKGGEPVVEATKPEPSTAKAVDISIHDAAKEGNIEAVKQRLAAGTDVNVKDKWDMTPLHQAAARGHKEVIELLIENGADVNAKDEDGGTPLLYVTLSGHKETADLLRRHGGKTGEELKAEGK